MIPDYWFLVCAKEAYQHNISKYSDDIGWDNEGNVWIAYFTGARKAYEYNQLGAGFQTSSCIGFLAFEVLENNQITFSAMDSDTHIYGQDGLYPKFGNLIHT